MEATRRRFAEKVKELGGAVTVAGLLGCTPQYISFLISGNGGRRPSIDLAFAIEQLMGIPMSAWASKPDAPALPGEPRVELDPVEPYAG